MNVIETTPTQNPIPGKLYKAYNPPDDSQNYAEVKQNIAFVTSDDMINVNFFSKISPTDIIMFLERLDINYFISATNNATGSFLTYKCLHNNKVGYLFGTNVWFIQAI
jgi:hypothetical protein